MKTLSLSRRTLLKRLAFMPAVGYGQVYAEVREQLTLDHRVDVLMIASSHPSDPAAERWRREYALKPFDGQGEWYVQSTTMLELPESLADMPGSLARFEYVAGVAAVESSMLVGAFRRDRIACVYRVRGEDDYVIALAEDFASRRIPERAEMVWNHSGLRSFIPTTERLGMDVSASEAFWP